MEMIAAIVGWVLVATAVVVLMTPALAFFYGGLVRPKNRHTRDEGRRRLGSGRRVIGRGASRRNLGMSWWSTISS